MLTVQQHGQQIAPTTPGEKHFLQFCLINRLFSPVRDILPASEARTVKHSTIKLYLAAVRNLPIFLARRPIPRQITSIKGWGIIFRYQGHTRILQQPVTPRVLLGIRPILRLWLGERYFAMNWADFTSPLIVEHTHLNVVCLVEFWQYLFFPITTTFNNHVFFAL